MGHKVLLADDSITVQKIVKLSLTEEGIEVIALGNGEQAVQQLEAIQPDLVMADVFMPGKDGYEVCEFVKAHPKFKHTPVILLVHAFEPFDPDRAKKVCADQQLTKPFQSIRTLVTTVQDLLATPESSCAVVETELPAEVTNNEVTSDAANFSVDSPSISNQPEEITAISSLSSAAFAMNESEPTLSEIPLPPPILDPPLSFFDSPQQGSLSATTLPILGADYGMAMEVAKTDFLPPLELSVLPQTDWHSTPMREAAPEIFDAAAMSPNTDQVVMGNVAEDVLDLSDVLPSNSVNLSTATELASSFSTVDETPLLAMLSSVAVETESMPDAMIPTMLPVPDNAALAESFDMGVGQISLEASVGTQAPVSSPDMAEAPIPATVPDINGRMLISEAMIEEITNRVIQRLSTQAIQEIAWEVVPEMAELLIRKQISQHPSLSH